MLYPSGEQALNLALALWILSVASEAGIPNNVYATTSAEAPENPYKILQDILHLACLRRFGLDAPHTVFSQDPRQNLGPLHDKDTRPASALHVSPGHVFQSFILRALEV